MTNYVDEAEKIIENLPEKGCITKTKIRDVLSKFQPLYEKSKRMRDEKLEEKDRNFLSRVRVQYIYDSGREKNVNDFISKAKLIDKVKKIDTYEDVRQFYHYLEALVAYHRYLRVKD